MFKTFTTAFTFVTFAAFSAFAEGTPTVERVTAQPEFSFTEQSSANLHLQLETRLSELRVAEGIHRERLQELALEIELVTRMKIALETGDLGASLIEELPVEEEVSYEPVELKAVRLYAFESWPRSRAPFFGVDNDFEEYHLGGAAIANQVLTRVEAACAKKEASLIDGIVVSLDESGCFFSYTNNQLINPLEGPEETIVMLSQLVAKNGGELVESNGNSFLYHFNR